MTRDNDNVTCATCPCLLTGDLVPLAVVVVGHDRDVVQVTVQRGHIVTGVYDLVAGAHSRRQQQA